jgi:ribonucleoside-diphosphate reductase alpha chain
MEWLTDNTRKFLQLGYLVGSTTPEERIRQVANRAEEINGIPGFSDKFFDYMARGFFSLASPVWSNFGMKRGLPISCFGSFIGDDMGEILYTQAEVGMMSKLGGGRLDTLAHFVTAVHRSKIMDTQPVPCTSCSSSTR